MSSLRIFVLAGLLAWTGRAGADEGLSPTSEAWNAGVEAYRAGDVTNALAYLRPLMQVKSHAARAAELVAKIEYDEAHRIGAADSLAHLEAAATAAQIALRANPRAARARDNFTRATDGLAELRETVHVDDVLARAEGKDPAAGVKEARDGVRAALAKTKDFATLPPAERLAAADDLERKLTAYADVWLPLREQAAKSMTNETEAAQIRDRLTAARDLTLAAARQAGDLAAGASDATAEAERLFTGFYKAIVPAPEALGEGELAQSNACARVEEIGGRAWQDDALDYTKAFRARFPSWAEQYEQSRQANTNAPPLTAEARAKIEELAAALESEQLEATGEDEQEHQRKALDLLRQIRGLMPQEPPPPKRQDQDRKDRENDPKQQDKNKDQDRKGQDQQSQDRQEDESRQKPEENSDREQDESKESEASESKERQEQEASPAEAGDEKSPEEKEAEALLRQLEDASAEQKQNARKRNGRRVSGKDW